MTKGGIHAFTRALAANLLPDGIRVNAVAPGPVWTALNPADKEASDVGEFGADTPMKRPAQPEELAPVYVFSLRTMFELYNWRNNTGYRRVLKLSLYHICFITVVRDGNFLISRCGL